MIHVIITGPPKGGRMPYRIEGQSANHGNPILNLEAGDPLLDACRVLAGMGEPPDHLIGIFDNRRYPDWAARTTVGYGSRYDPRTRTTQRPSIRFSNEGGPSPLTPETSPTGGGTAFTSPLDAGVPTGEPVEDNMGQYREYPGGPIKETAEPPPGNVTPPSDAPPATPVEPPPPPRKPPEPPADTGPAHAKPATSGKSHHRPKPKGSGGSRGLSRGR